MDDAHSCTRSPRFLFLFSAVLLAIAATPAAMRLFDATANDALPFATYMHGTLRDDSVRRESCRQWRAHR